MGDIRIQIEEASTASGTVATLPAPDRTGISRRTVVLGGVASLALAASGLAGGVLLERGRPASVPGFRRLTFRRGLIRSARLGPDGETLLYGALWEGDACRVHTGRVDGPESHRQTDSPTPTAGTAR